MHHSKTARKQPPIVCQDVLAIPTIVICHNGTAIYGPTIAVYSNGHKNQVAHSVEPK